MSETLEVPHFRSEAEEAEWLYANREARDNEFVRAFEEGRVRGGTVEERMAARAKLIDDEDEKKARELAKSRGVDYVRYVRGLIHEAILKESAISR